MTNFERIKQMTIEEMAEMLDNLSYSCSISGCKGCPIKHSCSEFNCDLNYIKEWLESEAENDT